jgi:DNA polymerase-3 subunit delta'
VRLVGQDRAEKLFLDAWNGRRIHHAWLLAGPRGVGKASFAKAAALRVLAEAAGPSPAGSAMNVEPEHRIARLVAAGSHPDYRLLERLERPTGGLARNISVHQVRSLFDMLSVTPSLSPWRAIIIDAADDLEASAANALLKMLEEPPADTLFFLVAHAPGRLLPTIRSRCRRLDFQALGDDVMASQVRLAKPDLPEPAVRALVDHGQGSIGRALAAADLELAPLVASAKALMADGDRDNARRSQLSKELGGKAAAERYAAFLQMVPGLIAAEAQSATGAARERALEAYEKARQTAAIAPRLSLDPAMTAFHLGGLLASLSLKA